MPQVVEPSLLSARLAALRRRWRLIVATRGGAGLIGAVLISAVAAGLLDWRLHLPGLVRAVLLLGTIVAAGVIAYRYLFRPLQEKTDDLSLALRIEKEYPELNDSLASTVQFLEEPDAERHGSASLRRAAMHRALTQAEACDFQLVVNSRGVASASLGMLGAMAIAVTLIVLQPAAAWTALVRLADPFGPTQWPPETRLVELNQRSRIAQGETFEIRATVEGIIPEKATVAYRFGTETTPTEQTYPIGRKDGDATGSLLARIGTGRLAGTFRYQVRANDTATPWREVQVLPPIRLVQLDGRPSPQIRLTYPAYTEFPTHGLADGTANIEAVVGTRVALRAAVDRPLSAAAIEHRPEQPVNTVAAFLGPLGAVSSDHAAALTVAGQQVWGRFPARLERDGQVLHIDFLPWISGTYALRLEDETGLLTTRLFDVRLLEDPTPQVNLQRPSASLDSLAVLPTAEVTIQVLVDDIAAQPGVPTGLRTVYLSYRTHKDDPPRTLTLFDHGATDAVVSRLGGVLAPGPVPTPKVAYKSRPPRLELTHRLPLKSLRHRDGSELREGDVLSLQAYAADFDNVAVDKQPGRSHEIELRIVGRPALEAVLHQAQAKIQQEIMRLRERQTDALQKVDAAEKQWRNTGRLRLEDQENLLQAGETQKEIRGRVGAPEEGLRAEVNRVLQTLRDNQLPRSGTHERMEMIARELERLAREELDPIEPLLTNARKESELAGDKPQPKGKDGALAQALDHQEEVKKTLGQLLEKLEPWSTTREVKGEARAILEEERRLSGQTDKLSRDIPLGKNFAELRPEQRAELERAAEWQARLAEHAGQLLNKMERVAQEKRQLADDKQAQAKHKARLVEEKKAEAKALQKKDPEKARLQLEEAQELAQEIARLREEAATLKDEAAALEDAAKQGRAQDLAGKMKRASDEVGQNQLGKATTDQKDSMAALEKVVRALEDRREEELDRLIKNLREAEKELARLQEEQDLLQKKVKDAEKIADPAERKAELQKLSRRQEELRKQSQDMLQKLSRLRSDRAREALSRAGGEMQDAGQRLERGDAPEDQQDEALDRLDEARQEIERARQEAEEELAREKLLKIADQLRMLKERHEALIPRVADVHKDTLERKRFDRPLYGRLKDHADAQVGISQEAAALAGEKLKGAIVFARLLHKAADLMDEAAADMRARVDKGKENAGKELDVKAAEAASAQTLRLMRDAQARMDQLLDALKPENAAGAGRRPNQGQPGGGQQPGGGPKGQGDGIPYLAQLKALKALQEDINRRTEDFARQNPDAAKLTKDEQKKLDELRKEQQEIAELLQELTAPAAEPEGAKQ